MTQLSLDLSQEDLLFRDSFCLKSLEGLRLVLVDHNILPAEDSGYILLKNKL